MRHAVGCHERAIGEYLTRRGVTLKQGPSPPSLNIIVSDSLQGAASSGKTKPAYWTSRPKSEAEPNIPPSSSGLWSLKSRPEHKTKDLGAHPYPSSLILPAVKKIKLDGKDRCIKMSAFILPLWVSMSSKLLMSRPRILARQDGSSSNLLVDRQVPMLKKSVIRFWGGLLFSSDNSRISWTASLSNCEDMRTGVLEDGSCFNISSISTMPSQNWNATFLPRTPSWSVHSLLHQLVDTIRIATSSLECEIEQFSSPRLTTRVVLASS